MTQRLLLALNLSCLLQNSSVKALPQNMLIFFNDGYKDAKVDALAVGADASVDVDATPNTRPYIGAGIDAVPLSLFQPVTPAHKPLINLFMGPQIFKTIKWGTQVYFLMFFFSSNTASTLRFLV